MSRGNVLHSIEQHIVFSVILGKKQKNVYSWPQEILDSFLDFIVNGKLTLKASRNTVSYSVEWHSYAALRLCFALIHSTCAAVFRSRLCRLITIYFNYTTRNDYDATSRPVTRRLWPEIQRATAWHRGATLNDLLGDYRAKTQAWRLFNTTSTGRLQWLQLAVAVGRMEAYLEIKRSRVNSRSPGRLLLS